ncbi:replication restart DNA helicase PriA [Phormidesmis sp. 146-35]
MQTVQTVRCPNCGSHAERHHLESNHLTRTQCPTCDYLMITCAKTGKVIEAYAPGIYARR